MLVWRHNTRIEWFSGNENGKSNDWWYSSLQCVLWLPCFWTRQVRACQLAYDLLWATISLTRKGFTKRYSLCYYSCQIGLKPNMSSHLRLNDRVLLKNRNTTATYLAVFVSMLKKINCNKFFNIFLQRVTWSLGDFEHTIFVRGYMI